MNILHHFGPQTYIKETFFRAGETIPMHEHVQSHLSVLCQGFAEVTIDGVSQEIRGPKVLNIEAGRKHQVKALSAITWLCIWATDETDPEKIDETLVDQPNV